MTTETATQSLAVRARPSRCRVASGPDQFASALVRGAAASKASEATVPRRKSCACGVGGGDGSLCPFPREFGPEFVDRRYRGPSGRQLLGAACRSIERERDRDRERERERERERRSLGLGALGPGPLPGRPRPRLEVQVRMMTRRFIQAEGASLRRLLKVQRRVTVCK